MEYNDEEPFAALDEAAQEEAFAYEDEYQAKMKAAEKLKPAVDALMEKMRCYLKEGPLHGEAEPIYRYCGHKHTGNFVVPWTSQGCSYAIELATIVVAATDSEVERLRQWKAEATEVIDGLQELGKALDIPLGERVTGTAATEAAKRLRTERDAMREAVTRLGEADQRAIHMYSDSMVKWNARAEADGAKLRDVAALADKWERMGILRSMEGTVSAKRGRELQEVLAQSQAPQAPTEQEGAWVDRHGDVWRFAFDGTTTVERNGRVIGTEKGEHASREYVEKKWGPLMPALSADDKGVQHG